MKYQQTTVGVDSPIIAIKLQPYEPIGPKESFNHIPMFWRLGRHWALATCYYKFGYIYPEELMRACNAAKTYPSDFISEDMGYEFATALFHELIHGIFFQRFTEPDFSSEILIGNKTLKQNGGKKRVSRKWARNEPIVDEGAHILADFTPDFTEILNGLLSECIGFQPEPEDLLTSL